MLFLGDSNYDCLSHLLILCRWDAIHSAVLTSFSLSLALYPYSQRKVTTSTVESTRSGREDDATALRVARGLNSNCERMRAGRIVVRLGGEWEAESMPEF